MSKHSPISLGRAWMVASMLCVDAEKAGVPAQELVPAGDLRRYRPSVDRVVLLAVAGPDRRDEIRAALAQLEAVDAATDGGAGVLGLETSRGPVDVYIVAPEAAGAALVWHTGSAEHVAALQTHARARGLLFEEACLARAAGVPVETPDEAAFYEALGLPLIPPELRDGHEVIAHAERGLPPLVSPLHIRGDLHAHTTWSDGRDTVLAMAEAARRLGYEYLAITDHSARSTASRCLQASEIVLQRQEIDEAMAAVPGLQILHGVEVEIMPDGSLDFDDAQLAAFDIVLASLHGGHAQHASRLEERYLSAIRHPLVNVITHPANRVPAGTDGYDLDFDRLFDEAVRSGTAMEIDGSPSHLDMDGRLARRAVAAGATIVVNGDSHRAEALGAQMDLGIGTARRGLVPPDRVLNARSLDAVLSFVAQKRTG